MADVAKLLIYGRNSVLEAVGLFKLLHHSQPQWRSVSLMVLSLSLSMMSQYRKAEVTHLLWHVEFNLQNLTGVSYQYSNSLWIQCSLLLYM